MKHLGIEIKFYNLDTFKKQIDVNFIDLDSNLVDLNYKVASLIFCQFWRSIPGSVEDLKNTTFLREIPVPKTRFMDFGILYENDKGEYAVLNDVRMADIRLASLVYFLCLR